MIYMPPASTPHTPALHHTVGRKIMSYKQCRQMWIINRSEHLNVTFLSVCLSRHIQLPVFHTIDIKRGNPPPLCSAILEDFCTNVTTHQLVLRESR